MNFKEIQNARKSFINKHKDEDHHIIVGKNNILISAPHGVSQVRLGRPKHSEIGSLATALFLQKETNSYLIAKTKNNYDDANFDEVSSYKTSIENLIKSNNIKYLIDFHGLAAERDLDVNLGINLGQNIKSNEKIFNDLYNKLKKNFVTLIDKPFKAGSRTIAGGIANKYPNVWTIQIEINCKITNDYKYFKKYTMLLNILKDWINTL